MQNSNQLQFIIKLVAYLITLNKGKNRKRYRIIISGLLPEAIAQNRSNQDSINFVLKKWLQSSDNEVQIISKLLQRGIRLTENFWILIGSVIILPLILFFLLNSFSKKSYSALSPPSSTIEIVPSPVQNRPLTKLETVALINEYLQKKENIYGPPFDPKIAASITTGKLLEDIIKPEGAIDSLKQKQAYYKYGKRIAEPLAFFSVSDNIIQIDVKITEKVLYYQYGRLKSDENEVEDYRFILQREGSSWKIADRKPK